MRAIDNNLPAPSFPAFSRSAPGRVATLGGTPQRWSVVGEGCVGGVSYFYLPSVTAAWTWLIRVSSDRARTNFLPAKTLPGVGHTEVNMQLIFASARAEV